MKLTIVILHGTGGYPEENWFPWLRKRLEERGCNVIVPQFPTPKGQSLEAWLAVLNRYGEHINESTIFIGHSLGGLFLLRLLERLSHKIRGAIFVGAPVGMRPIMNYEADLAFSGGFDFNWSEIRTKANTFVVFHSDTDPYVGLENGKELAARLGVDLSFVPNAGHFNREAGYLKFDELWRRLEALL